MEQQNYHVPLTVVEDNSKPVSFDDLSSCDSSISSHYSQEDDDNLFSDEESEDYEDGGLDEYHDDEDSSTSSPVMMATVAEAVQHLNQQNKLERVVAKAKSSGLRLKISRPSRRTTMTATGALPANSF